MKESLYNIYFTTPDGTELVFNSFSRGLASVDGRYKKLLSMLPNIKETSLPKSLKEVLGAAEQGHFLISDDYNEIEEYLTKQRTQRYATDALGLTIAPTLNCNFKCIYCYETSKPGIMDEATQKNLIEFVRKQSKRLNSLNVTWYGGEPLLAHSIINALSKKMIAICKEESVEYHAYIITNGYLLNNEIIEMLKMNKVDGAQVTIDGPKRVHDARRVNKSGKSSFDRIIENINKLIKNKINVSIRINTDKTNEKNIEELISFLEKNLISKKVAITFGQVTASTSVCRAIESSCFNNITFAKRLKKYYAILHKYGFEELNPYPYPTTKFNYCCADLLNSFVTDPEGYLYKCWNDVGVISESVGNINDPTLDIFSWKNGQKIKHLDPIPSKCSKCAVLPICAGGCSHNGNKRSKAVCGLERYSIIDTMKIYYEASLKNKSNGKEIK